MPAIIIRESCRITFVTVCWEVCPTWWIANGNDYCDEFASFEHLPGTLEQVSFMQVYLLLNVRRSLNIACRIVFIKFDLNCCVMRAVPQFFFFSLFKTCSNLVPSNLDYVTSLINTTNLLFLSFIFNSRISTIFTRFILFFLPAFSNQKITFYFYMKHIFIWNTPELLKLPLSSCDKRS